MAGAKWELLLMIFFILGYLCSLVSEYVNYFFDIIFSQRTNFVVSFNLKATQHFSRYDDNFYNLVPFPFGFLTFFTF